MGETFVILRTISGMGFVPETPTGLADRAPCQVLRCSYLRMISQRGERGAWGPHRDGGFVLNFAFFLMLQRSGQRHSNSTPLGLDWTSGISRQCWPRGRIRHLPKQSIMVSSIFAARRWIMGWGCVSCFMCEADRDDKVIGGSYFCSPCESGPMDKRIQRPFVLLRQPLKEHGGNEVSIEGIAFCPPELSPLSQTSPGSR